LNERQYIPAEEEIALLRATATGDKPAFEKLYNLYAGGLEKYILFITRSKETTEEIVQDSFLRLWQKRERLPELTSFRSYLYRIARNRALSYFRSLKTRRLITELDDPTENARHMASAPGAHPEGADHLALYNQYYKIALDAIDRLPPRKKEIFNLSLEEDLTLDEIAERLNLTKSTVKQHLYAAAAAVREYLLRHGNITPALFLFLSLLER
jgi:RNA polymerase sigma-70 factor (family 1)